MRSGLPHFVAVLILLVLTGLVYGHTLHYTFHFDDYYFITENLKIRDITDLNAIWYSLGKPSRFLGMLSFALNYHFSGTEVVGYHIVNILIHAVNGCLVYGLVLATLRLAPRPPERARGLALFAAAVFVVHPVNTQAVTYIAQRFASMATMFYLLAMCCYVRGRQTAIARRRAFFFGAALISCVAGMFTKQIVLTLPVMVLLYEYCFFRKGRMVRVSWRGAVLLAGLFLLVPTLQSWDFHRIFGAEIASRSHAGDILTWKSYLLTQFRVVPVYLRLMVFPVGQTLDYDFPVAAGFWRDGTWAGALLIIVILVGAVRLLKRDPLTGFSVLWFFLAMGLESSFIPIYQVIFEHRCYLPGVGFVLLLATWTGRLMTDRRRRTASMIVVVAALAWTAHQRNLVWENETTLWQDIMRKAPRKVRPYIHLGVARIMQGDYDGALKILDDGIAIRQDNYRLYHNRGLVYEMKGNLKEAMWNYSKAIELHSTSEVSLTNRAGLFIQINRFRLALDDYNAAIRAAPDYGNAYLGRGNLFYRAQRYREALADFERAVELGVPIETAELDKVRRLVR